MRIVFDDPDLERALARRAVAEVRPMGMQAQVLLRRALGLPAPYPPTTGQQPTPVSREGGAAC